MMYTSILFALIFVFVLSALGTAVLDIIFRFLGKRGYLGNLFPNVRGGIPRAIGVVPFLILSFYMLPGFNNLILIIGIFALIDDIVGRKKSRRLGIEWGQLSRGIGIILVIIIGLFEGLGVSAIFIALMVQPMNISDMQPGSCCMVTIIMSIVSIIVMLIINSPPAGELPAVYTPFLLLVVCVAYSPLDFSGKNLRCCTRNNILYSWRIMGSYCIRNHYNNANRICQKKQPESVLQTEIEDT